MRPPLVSIIIPLYNAEKYITQTLQSAIDQTWPHKEIIIVDDGSTDNSLALTEKFGSEGILLVKQNNQGASAARNLGLHYANGEFIQFLDADDFLSKNKIEQQMYLLKGNNEMLALCPTIYFHEGENPKTKPIIHEWFKEGTNDPVDFFIKLLGGSIIGPNYGGMIQPNSWLTPRSVIDKAGLWNEKLSIDDDGEYFSRVILASTGIRYSHQGVNYYRQFRSGNNLSGAKTLKAIQSRVKAIDYKYELLKKHSSHSLLPDIIGRQYWEAGIMAYPNFYTISTYCFKKVNELNYKSKEFQGSPRGKIINHFFGWRVARIISYLIHKF